MANLIPEDKLQTELIGVFEKAKREIVIVSPFIHLHERFRSALEEKRNVPRLNLTVLFGKNKESPGRSIRKEDLAFFMEFPNVRILYEPRLHAKCYANERACIVTSLNLVAASTNNNIEVGVYSKSHIPGRFLNQYLSELLIVDPLYYEMHAYIEKVVSSSKLIYSRERGQVVVNELEAFNLLPGLSKYNDPPPSNGDFEEVKSELLGGTNEMYISNSPQRGALKRITTNKLAERCGLDRQEMNKRLKNLGFQVYNDGKYELTDRGRQAGGEVRTGPYREFIVWPEGLFD